MPVIAVCKLESASDYSPSRFHDTEKETKEAPDAFDRRTWREKAHYDARGNVIIPATQFKEAIAEAAKYLSMPIKGRGKATYTKHFKAGIMVLKSIVLPVQKADLQSCTLLMNSQGKKGEGSRVPRTFPLIHEWAGELEVLVADSIITQEVFVEHLQTAGMLVGIGRWRPAVGGMNGRFTVKSVKWTKHQVAA